MGRRIGFELRGVDHGELGDVAAKLVVARRDEHVAGKNIVPSAGVDHPDRQAIVGIRTGEAIAHVDVVTLEIVANIPVKAVELSGLEGCVHGTPPDPVRRRGIPDHELVAGRSAGVLAGVHHQRAVPGQAALTTTDGVLDQRAGGEVPVGGPQVTQAVMLEAVVAARADTRIGH